MRRSVRSIGLASRTKGDPDDRSLLSQGGAIAGAQLDHAVRRVPCASVTIGEKPVKTPVNIFNASSYCEKHKQKYIASVSFTRAIRFVDFGLDSWMPTSRNASIDKFETPIVFVVCVVLLCSVCVVLFCYCVCVFL